jgi:hypothetical protein
MKIILGFTLALLSLGASAQSRLGRPTAGTFQQLAELTGSQQYELVSGGAAISGNTLVIGAPVANSPDGCIECGAAYVYTAVDGDWTNLILTATLTQSAGQSVGGFGAAVAISGDTIIVGGADATSGQGAAYIYTNPSGNSTEDAELTVSGGQGVGAVSGVAIDGDTVVIGIPVVSIGRNEQQGSAYVYVEPSGGWTSTTQTAQLLPSDGGGNFYFGTSVSISGRYIVVGAPDGTPLGGVSEQGLAYLFVEPAPGWSGIWGQTTEFKASDGTGDAAFGLSVSVSENVLVVGAPGQTIDSKQREGASYIFARPTTGWPKNMTETAELTESDGKPADAFGISVAISNKTVIAGAYLRHNRQGAAYIFGESSGGWQSTSSAEAIAAPDGAADNYFGRPVAIGGGVLAVCANGWPDGGNTGDGYGAVYVFGSSR